MIDSDIKYLDGAFRPAEDRQALSHEDGIYSVWEADTQKWICTEEIPEGYYLDCDCIYKRLDWAVALKCPELQEPPIASGWYLIEDSGGHEIRVQYDSGTWRDRYGLAISKPTYKSIRPIELGDRIK